MFSEKPKRSTYLAIFFSSTCKYSIKYYSRKYANSSECSSLYKRGDVRTFSYVRNYIAIFHIFQNNFHNFQTIQNSLKLRSWTANLAPGKVSSELENGRRKRKHLIHRCLKKKEWERNDFPVSAEKAAGKSSFPIPIG